jgi:hypothetical protein
MKKPRFVVLFAELAKRLNKRVSDEYLDAIADIIKIESWDEPSVVAVINSLTMNPPRELTGDIIRDAYFNIYRAKLNKEYNSSGIADINGEGQSNKEHIKFFVRFILWPKRRESFSTPSGFRDRVGYSKMSFFEKDLVDEYIKGRMEVRGSDEMPEWSN